MREHLLIKSVLSMTDGRRRGVGFALTAAALFGLSTPCAKLLLGEVEPILLAGLLYLGSGIGLFTLRWFVPAGSAGAHLRRKDLPWLAGAVLCGGVIGPVLLMAGLRSTSASAASLLLNLEGVFTAALAWLVFRENVDRRVALGMILIVTGGIVLAWPAGDEFALPAASLAVAGACFCWAIDNNLTQKVSAVDPLQIAAIKGLVAGGVNVAGAFAFGAPLPAVGLVALALVVGLFGYGISLSMFVVALRYLGTARTGAYFSVAPFVGAIVSVALFHESLRFELLGAALLMALGIWLHLTERHDHVHEHEPLVHEHLHRHDEHHQHRHGPDDLPGEHHTHLHVHERMIHRHPHYPDLHHRHH